MSALMKRVLTAAAAVPVVLACLYWGRWAFYGLVLMASLLAMSELKNMLNQMGIVVSAPLLYTAAFIFQTSVAWREELWLPHIVFFVFLAVAAFELFSVPARPFARGGATLLAVFYGAFMPSHFLLLRAKAHGFELLLLVLLGTWAADTGAYFIGSRWGRRRLAPTISPNKSVEGAVGGLVGASLVVGYLHSFLQLQLLPGWILGLIVGAAAIIGDLFESILKREAGVKDSGKILPGHGGILDRIDSLLFAVPVVYYFVRWLA